MTPLAKRGDLRWRLRDAECIGYCRGFADKHYEDRTFETAAEYAAWLRGWRKGQADLRVARAQEAAEQARIERIMRNVLQEAA